MRTRTALQVILPVAVLCLFVGACGEAAAPEASLKVSSAPAAEPGPATSVPVDQKPVAEPTPSKSTPSQPAAAPRDDAPDLAPPPAPPAAQIGYRVTGVAANDVLNVRAGPSAWDAIVGELAHDATGVVVTSEGTSPWWEVVLDDGTRGFAHSNHLMRDPAWTVSFAELPCPPADAPWGETKVSVEPAGPSNAQFVYGYDSMSSPECERFVLQLGTRDSPPPPDYPSIAADHVPAGVAVRSAANRVIVTLPRTLDVRWDATTAKLDDTLVVATYGSEGWSQLEVHFIFGSEREAHARLLDDPARIVVDVRPAEAQSGIDLSAVVDGSFILTEPVHWDGRIPGTRQPLTITGYGTAYEGWAWMGLSRIDGNPDPIQALWSGGSNCTDEPGAATARGDSYCTSTSGTFIRGGFEIAISDLEPGSYVLSIADECMVDEVGEEGCEAQDLDYEFTVHGEPETAADALAPFFAAAEDWDARIAEAAAAFNAGFDAFTGTLSDEAHDVIDGLTGAPLMARIPAGMSPDLERAVLAVYADIGSRSAALHGARHRVEHDIEAAMRCLGHGSVSKARFADDLDLARALADREAAPHAAPDSAAAGELAVRIEAIGLWNGGCDGCGGATYDQTLPVDWGARMIEDRVSFTAEFDGTRWRIMINAC